MMSTDENKTARLFTGPLTPTVKSKIIVNNIPSDMDKSAGVYSILCSATNMVYIGSTVNIKARFRQHISELKQGHHHNYRLQIDYNKYGAEALNFNVVAEIEKYKGESTAAFVSRLREIEYKYMLSFEATGSNGYNIAHDPRKWDGYAIRILKDAKIEAIKQLRYLISKGVLPQTKKRILDSFFGAGRGFTDWVINQEGYSNIQLSEQDISLYDSVALLPNFIQFSENRLSLVRNKLAALRKGKPALTAKLTEGQVLQIKDQLLQGVRDEAIASEYSMSIGAIQQIRLGITWSKLTGFERNCRSNIKNSYTSNTKLTEADVLA